MTATNLQTPETTWTHPGVRQILDAIPVGAHSVLDVGCGRGLIGALCRIYRGPSRLVGIDGYRPYLEFCARHNFYDELLERRLEDVPLPFAEREFDVATCIEVIEHLDRPDGERLISELERVARTVVISTPTTYFEQHELDGNDLQRHRSVWAVRDFRRRGYAVQGAGGLKVLGRNVRFVSAAFAPMVRFVPSLSQVILCSRTSG